jgi:hypothetical protein
MITHLCFTSVSVQAIATMISASGTEFSLARSDKQIYGSGEPLEALG